MQSQSLAGVRLKLERAQHHFRDLHERIRVALSNIAGEDGKSGVVFENNAEGHAVIKLGRGIPLDPSLPMIVGDCFHNLRSALDHLTYQLALLNGTGRDAASRISFPVYATPKKFKNFVDSRVAKFISTAALREIESLQPYHTSDPPEIDALWQLTELDNIDKHRLFIVVAREFKLDSFDLVVEGGDKFSTSTPDSKWKPSVEGTEIIRFQLSAPAKVHVNIKTATTVKFANTAPFCDGRIVEDLMNECGTSVEIVIDYFGKMFFGE